MEQTGLFWYHSSSTAGRYSEYFMKLRNRLLLSLGGMVLLSLAGLGLYGFLAIRRQAHRLGDMASETQVTIRAQQINDFLQTRKNEVLFLSRWPDIRDLLEADDRSSSEAKSLADEVAYAFEQLMLTSRWYLQLRLLDARGREAVRVDCESKIPHRVPDDRLQDKSHRYYFREGMKQPPGGLYVSPLDLNRESGKIQKPYTPTLRLATPIFGSGGKKLGLVVANLHARPMFKHFTKIEQRVKGAYCFIVDQNGYYVHHALHPEKTFGGPDDLNTVTECVYPLEIVKGELVKIKIKRSCDIGLCFVRRSPHLRG